MTETYHIPAMLKETIESLAIKPNGVYVDVTFGGGGHSRAILGELQTPPQPSPQGEGDEPLPNPPHEGEGSRIPSGITDEKKKEEQPHPNPPHEGEGSRIISGTMDEAMNGGKNAAEENNEGGAVMKSHGEDEEGNPPILADSREMEPRGADEGKGHLYSFDQDIEAYENAKNPTPALPSREGEMPHKSLSNDERWTFVHSNFRYLKNWMDYYGVTEIDGLLADLGVSFHHFDCPERGFSFRYSAPLDMRMNQTAKRTAADIVNGYSEEELAKIFWLYGELKNGRGIARNICKARSQKPILRTEELVENLYPGKTPPNLPSREEIRDGIELEIPAQYKKDLARLFQALRIEVNDELGALREMLVAARDLLKPGGRIAILTYHSLEDRLVKNFLRSGNLEGTIEKDFYGNALTPFEVIEKGRVASDEEIERNPRSRSAKLRVAERK